MLNKPNSYRPPDSPESKKKDLEIAVKHKAQKEKIELAHRQLTEKP